MEELESIAFGFELRPGFEGECPWLEDVFSTVGEGSSATDVVEDTILRHVCLNTDELEEMLSSEWDARARVIIGGGDAPLLGRSDSIVASRFILLHRSREDLRWRLNLKINSGIVEQTIFSPVLK